jgi:hypothetical protein
VVWGYTTKRAPAEAAETGANETCRQGSARAPAAAVRGGDAMVPLKHDGVCDFGREVMCGGGGLSCAASACAVSLWRCQTARPVPCVVIALDCVGMRAMMLTAHTRSCQLPSLVLDSQPRPCAVRGHRLPGHTGLWGVTDRWPRPFTASPSCAAQTNTNKHTSRCRRERTQGALGRRTAAHCTTARPCQLC